MKYKVLAPKNNEAGQDYCVCSYEGEISGGITAVICSTDSEDKAETICNALNGSEAFKKALSDAVKFISLTITNPDKQPRGLERWRDLLGIRPVSFTDILNNL